MHNHILLYAKKKKQKETDTHKRVYPKPPHYCNLICRRFAELPLAGLDWTGLAWLGQSVLSYTPFLCAVRMREQSRAEEPPVANKNCTALASNWRECKQTLCEQPTRERRTRVARLPYSPPTIAIFFILIIVCASPRLLLMLFCGLRCCCLNFCMCMCAFTCALFVHGTSTR